jgi:hypothetical protein
VCGAPGACVRPCAPGVIRLHEKRMNSYRRVLLLLGCFYLIPGLQEPPRCRSAAAGMQTAHARRVLLVAPTKRSCGSLARTLIPPRHGRLVCAPRAQVTATVAIYHQMNQENFTLHGNCTARGRDAAVPLASSTNVSAPTSRRATFVNGALYCYYNNWSPPCQPPPAHEPR